jgi:hypothetical protein
MWVLTYHAAGGGDPLKRMIESQKQGRRILIRIHSFARLTFARVAQEDE